MCVFVCTCIDIWRELDGHIPCYEQGIYLIFEITGGMVFVLHFSPWPYCWFCNETQLSIFFFLRHGRRPHFKKQSERKFKPNQ